jgi:hypothetical protein
MTKKATDRRTHKMMGLAEPATLEDRIRAEGDARVAQSIDFSCLCPCIR